MLPSFVVVVGTLVARGEEEEGGGAIKGAERNPLGILKTDGMGCTEDAAVVVGGG